MAYTDPEKRRAYHREYYRKKMAPGGEKHEQYLAYQNAYYHEKLGVGGEKHEEELERSRKYRREKYAPGGEKHDQAREWDRAYYREKRGVGGEKHEQHLAYHNEYRKRTMPPGSDKRVQYNAVRRRSENSRYQKNKETIQERRRQKQQGIVEWFKQYKANASCISCGENHPACLHFHHRNKAEKEYNISAYVFRASSLEKFIKELSKCDVLCANCHAIEHWQEGVDLSELEQRRAVMLDTLQSGNWFERRGVKSRLTHLETIIWFHRYKATLQCQSCGINHPGCLQFHHRNGSEKTDTVGNLASSANLERLKREISKCDVLCANCHAKLHWEERNED